MIHRLFHGTSDDRVIFLIFIREKSLAWRISMSKLARLSRAGRDIREIVEHHGLYSQIRSDLVGCSFFAFLSLDEVRHDRTQ